jgi:DNA-binding NarL/FixJ family response regulator
MYNTAVPRQFVKRDNSIQQTMKSEPISIVIVESHPIARATLSKAFSAEGIDVVANITQSQSALQVACTLDPDFILYSVNSPEIDELHRIMILRRELPNTLILVLVPSEIKGQERLFLDHGAHQVLSKASHHNEIVEAVRALAHAHLPSILFTAQPITQSAALPSL